MNDSKEDIETLEPDDVLDDQEEMENLEPATVAPSARRAEQFDSRSGVTERPPAGMPLTPEPMVLDLYEAAEMDAEPGAAARSGMGLCWDYVRRACPVSMGLKLRTLVECLSSLGALHTDLTTTPKRRHHGAVWHGNLLVKRDGSVLLVRSENTVPQPSAYAAPELRTGRTTDQQADVYAVGVMLLETLTEQSLRAGEVLQLSSGELALHPFWGRFADDPLLWVAMRATARDPAKRWPTAREFADALVQCAFDRMVSKRQLGALIDLVLAEQADRATPLVSAPTSARGASQLVLPMPPELTDHGERVPLPALPVFTQTRAQAAPEDEFHVVLEEFPVELVSTELGSTEAASAERLAVVPREVVPWSARAPRRARPVLRVLLAAAAMAASVAAYPLFIAPRFAQDPAQAPAAAVNAAAPSAARPGRTFTPGTQPTAASSASVSAEPTSAPSAVSVPLDASVTVPLASSSAPTVPSGAPIVTGREPRPKTSPAASPAKAPRAGRATPNSERNSAPLPRYEPEGI